eukprot:COSAG06_NODE_271_length_18677_cov_157.113360_2_plen_643_part_00
MRPSAVSLLCCYQLAATVATCGAVQRSTIRSAASESPSSSRSVPLLGLGNELVWQSLDDASLAKAIGTSGSFAGRYPGGTPSDYWNYTTGFAVDGCYEGPDGKTEKCYHWPPVRQATPAQWTAYCTAAGTRYTVVCLNQLTNTLDASLDGLRALAAAGTAITHVEMGNEQYDDTRGDVLQAYPNGSAYAAKMVTWSAAIKAKFPEAKIALVTMSWRSSLSPHLASWNGGVWNDNPAVYVDAATIHPYFRLKSVAPQHQQHPAMSMSLASGKDCGIPKMGASGSWIATATGCTDACCCASRCAAKPHTCRAWQWMTDPKDPQCYLKANGTLAKNDGSTSGLSAPAPPPAPPPSPAALANALSTPFEALVENARMLAKDVPHDKELWATEVAAYGASELNFTWLRALVDVTFEALLMLRMHTSEGLGASAVTVLTPYCAACADPMAPSFETAGAAASGSRAVLPVGEENTSAWTLNVRGIAHQLLFAPLAEAHAAAKDEARMTELNFDTNLALAGGVGAKWNASALLGFSVRSSAVAAAAGAVAPGASASAALPSALVLFNLGQQPIELGVAAIFDDGTSVDDSSSVAAVLLDVTTRYPKSVADMLNQSLTPAQLVSNITSGAEATAAIELPPYSITTVRRVTA